MKKKFGFSLIEVNMAIFVMAIGVLAVASLFPLGLRENMNAVEDMTESIFADGLLNQAVGIASGRNVKWSEWNDDDKNPIIRDIGGGTSKGLTCDKFRSQDSFSDLPGFLRRDMKMPSLVSDGSDKNGVRHFRIACCRPPAHSGRVMGIMVQCTTEDAYDRNDYSNRPIYYAEAYFQGDYEK